MTTTSRLIFMGIIVAAIAFVGVSGVRSLLYLKNNIGGHKMLCTIAMLGVAGIAWIVWYIVTDLWAYWCLRGPSLYDRYGWGSVLVTGASDGIGFAYCKQLAALGFEVIMHGRNEAKLEEKKADILKLHPNSKIHTVIADLSQPLTDEMKHDILRVPHEKPISILINNAGIGPSGLLTKMELLLIQKTIYVNVQAPTELMKMFLPLMLAQDKHRCAVLNVSSIASLGLLPGMGLYSGTKACLSTLTRCVAHECADSHIDFLNMMPGPVLTQIFTQKGEPTVIEPDYAAGKHLTFIGRRLDSYGVIVHWVRAHFWLLSPSWVRRKLVAGLLKALAAPTIKPT